MELIKKLSTKTIVGKITRGDVPAKGIKPMFRVMGTAMGTKSGQSNYGDFLAFRGNFKAIRIEDKEVFASAVCFLPQMATDILLPAVEHNIASGGTGVMFAFDIGIKAADNAVGYEYTVIPLTDTADSLDSLENSLPKLPSPKVAKEKE